MGVFLEDKTLTKINVEVPTKYFEYETLTPLTTLTINLSECILGWYTFQGVLSVFHCKCKKLKNHFIFT